MVHTLIIGIDTVAGRSLAQQLSKSGDVTGLWFRKAQYIDDCQSVRISEVRLKKQVSAADLVVFCGDASASSWDPGFGDFETEEQWLKPCLKAVAAHHRRMIFLSSDVVFSGPWVFHDDDSNSLALDRTAKHVLRYEALVRQHDDALIVRANVLGAADGSFFSDSLDALLNNRSITADASTFATPLSAGSFAKRLESCIAANVSGVINIAGGERTTPFRFVHLLAHNLNLSTEQLEPESISGRSCERSMRCQRLMKELNLRAPLLAETVECLSDLAGEQQLQAIAA